MASSEQKKKDIYRWIKIGGLLSFLPFILAAGPLAGYALGDYLEKKFGFPHYASLIFIALGFAGSIRETVRIVKMALRAEEKK